MGTYVFLMVPHRVSRGLHWGRIGLLWDVPWGLLGLPWGLPTRRMGLHEVSHGAVGYETACYKQCQKTMKIVAVFDKSGSH